MFLSGGLTYTIFYANQFKSPSGSRPEYWGQAISAFRSSPIVGAGPGTFGNSNRLYRNDISSSTNYAHNSVLEFLSGNGLLFTLILFGAIGYGLWYQYHHHHLFFIIGITSFINSLLDASWSSPGIFILSMIMIFWDVHKTNSRKFVIIMATPLLLFLISKTFSDIYYIQKNYRLSLLLDPFNPNSLTATLPSSTDSALQLYRNDPFFYTQLTSLSPLPDNESYYDRLFELDPHGSINQYIRLINYYKDKDWDKTRQILSLANSNLNFTYLTQQQKMVVAKSSYAYALYLWNNHQQPESLLYFHDATRYSQDWSHFYIEEANALWNIGKKNEAYTLLSIDCPQHLLSALHCQQYLQQRPQFLPSPGAYKDGINSIDISKLSPEPPDNIPENL